MFDSHEAVAQRAARPRWLRRLLAVGQGVWLVLGAGSMAGTFFVLCWAIGQLIKGGG